MKNHWLEYSAYYSGNVVSFSGEDGNVLIEHIEFDLNSRIEFCYRKSSRHQYSYNYCHLIVHDCPCIDLFDNLEHKKYNGTPTPPATTSLLSTMDILFDSHFGPKEFTAHFVNPRACIDSIQNNIKCVDLYYDELTVTPCSP